MWVLSVEHTSGFFRFVCSESKVTDGDSRRTDERKGGINDYMIGQL
jgi:hypothetical protein